MNTIRVWTKQHRNVLEILKKEGRYAASKDIVHRTEDAYLMINAYDWLVDAIPDRKSRPCDADYPVWLSFNKAATMMLTPNTVMMELEIDRNLITYLNVEKWSLINNCTYLPRDKEDEKRHKKLMADLGITDIKACTTQFYPEIKEKIEQSWNSAFENGEKTEGRYGLVWELRREWIIKVTE